MRNVDEMEKKRGEGEGVVLQGRRAVQNLCIEGWHLLGSNNEM